MSLEEEDRLLKQSVISALETKGSLNSIRAKLRAEVFDVMQKEMGGPEAVKMGAGKVDFSATVPSNTASLAIVYDFLSSFGFDSALRVLEAESGVASNASAMSLESISKTVGYDVGASAGGEKSALGRIVSNPPQPSLSGTGQGGAGAGAVSSGAKIGADASVSAEKTSHLPPPPPQTSNMVIGDHGASRNSEARSPPKSLGSPVNRNVRLDISDDSVEDIIPPGASQPNRIESLNTTSKLAPLSASSPSGKPKLASLSTSPPKATDPFSKPKLPSPTPSPNESLDDSMSKSLDKSLEKSNDKSTTSSKAASPAKTNKTEESYEDDYEDDDFSGGSFDDIEESMEQSTDLP